MTANQQYGSSSTWFKKTVVVSLVIAAAGVIGLLVSFKPSSIRPPRPEIPPKPYMPIRKASTGSKSKNVTLVTAFFNIGTFEKGSATVQRNQSTYKQWITVYAFIENAVAAYFDDTDMAQHFAKLREGKPTKITMVDRKQMWAFSLQNRTQAIFDQPGYPRNLPKSTNAAYACTMHAKYELLARTVNEDPFGTVYFAWLDVGLFRDLTGPGDHTPFRLNTPKCYQRGTVAASKVYRTNEGSVEDIMRNGVDWVAGGLLMADSDTMMGFCEDYMRRTEDLLNRGLANHDQSIILSMYCPRSVWKAAIPLQAFEGSDPDPFFYLAYQLRAEWLNQLKPVSRQANGFQCSYKVFT